LQVFGIFNTLAYAAGAYFLYIEWKSTNTQWALSACREHQVPEEQQQQLPRPDLRLLSVRPRKFWHDPRIVLGKKVSAGKDGLKLVRRDPPQIVCSLKKDSVPTCLKISYLSWLSSIRAKFVGCRVEKSRRNRRSKRSATFKISEDNNIYKIYARIV